MFKGLVFANLAASATHFELTFATNLFIVAEAVAALTLMAFSIVHCARARPRVAPVAEARVG